MLVAAAHLVLGFGLFWSLNWIGDHAASFGYMNLSTPFSQDAAPAFNFVLRTGAPVVFIIVSSMVLYGLGWDAIVVGIWRVAVINYLLRFGFIVAMDRLRVINIPKFLIQTIIGVTISYIAYVKLILPKTPLFPSAASIAGELWIAIALFGYAVLNNIRVGGDGSDKRRKRYLTYWINRIRHRYAHLIDGKMDSRLLELAAYAIIVYENYNRPPFARWLERTLPSRRRRTVGVMQVESPAGLSDEESVERGVGLLNQFRSEVLQEHGEATASEWFRVNRSIAKYNRDDSYVFEVEEIMRALAMQVMPEYRVEYEAARQSE